MGKKNNANGVLVCKCVRSGGGGPLHVTTAVRPSSNVRCLRSSQEHMWTQVPRAATKKERRAPDLLAWSLLRVLYCSTASRTGRPVYSPPIAAYDPLRHPPGGHTLPSAAFGSDCVKCHAAWPSGVVLSAVHQRHPLSVHAVCVVQEIPHSHLWGHRRTGQL